jgi:hypothetical protein
MRKIVYLCSFWKPRLSESLRDYTSDYRSFYRSRYINIFKQLRNSRTKYEAAPQKVLIYFVDPKKYNSVTIH